MLKSTKIMNGYYFEGSAKDLARLGYVLIMQRVPFSVKKSLGDTILTALHKDAF